jgi:hypothetical protein
MKEQIERALHCKAKHEGMKSSGRPLGLLLQLILRGVSSRDQPGSDPDLLLFLLLLTHDDMSSSVGHIFLLQT